MKLDCQNCPRVFLYNRKNAYWRRPPLWCKQCRKADRRGYQNAYARERYRAKGLYTPRPKRTMDELVAFEIKALDNKQVHYDQMDNELGIDKIRVNKLMEGLL